MRVSLSATQLLKFHGLWPILWPYLWPLKIVVAQSNKKLDIQGLTRGTHLYGHVAHLGMVYRVSGLSVLKQWAVNQLFLEISLMFLACLDHKWWAQFHLGILGQHG